MPGVHSVTFVTGANQIGGAERQVKLLSDGLRRRGVRAEVLFLERPYRRPPAKRIAPTAGPLQHLWLGQATGVLGRGVLELHLRRHRPDVMHLYNVDAAQFVGAHAKSRAVPLVLASVRGLLFERDAGVAETLRASREYVDGFTTNCRAIADALRRSGIAGELPLEVLPNLVETRLAPAEGADSEPRVLFVATLKEVKEPGCFLEACEKVWRAHPSARFQLVGDGPLRATLERQAERLGISDRTEFSGALAPEDVPYGGAAVVVSSSRSEGSSNTLLEALAAGVPVVATAVGGSVEIVEDSGAGRLVRAEDTQALAEAMSELLADPALRARLGSLGRQYVERVHAPERVLDAHLSTYEALLERAAGNVAP